MRRCFNPLPPPKRGEIPPRSRRRNSSSVSIRSPRRSEGRSRKASISVISDSVSIRSPRRSEGRSAGRAVANFKLLFQSAPPAEARGDRDPPTATTPDSGFNPLPPPKRGEIGFGLGPAPPILVSIRSPRRSEGRSSSANRHGPLLMFQSAPPAEARGDLTRRNGSANYAVSIRSPRRSEGRSMVRSTMTRPSMFQSAPPAEARGDLLSVITATSLSRFQSAPPAEARGDAHPRQGSALRPCVSIRSPRRSEGRCCPGVGGWRPVPVSIRSPRRSEGRSTRLRFVAREEVVSIRSPRRSEGRSERYRAGNPAGRGFNPLPPPKRGEMAWLG